MISPLVTQQLSLRLQASAIYCWLVTLLHGAAGLGLWLLGLPDYWSVVLGFALLTSWLVALLRDGLRLRVRLRLCCCKRRMSMPVRSGLVAVPIAWRTHSFQF